MTTYLPQILYATSDLHLHIREFDLYLQTYSRRAWDIKLETVDKQKFMNHLYLEKGMMNSLLKFKNNYHYLQENENIGAEN